MVRKTLLRLLVPTTIALTAGPIAAAQEGQQQQPRQTQQQGAKQTGQQQGAAMQQALVQLHAINQTETELALAGINQAQNEDVRDLAKKIAKEHQEGDRELMEQARKLGMDVTPSQESQQAIQQMERQNQQLMQQLQQAEGAQFDRAFVQALVQTHQSALEKVRSTGRNVQNEQVNKLVQSRTSKLESHLEEAQELQQKLKAKQ